MPIWPPRVDSSTGCLLAYQEQWESIHTFCIFVDPWEKYQNCPNEGQDALFPTSQDPANILGMTNCYSDIFHFVLHSRLPDFQTPSAAVSPLLLDELSDPNPTPLPTHPGIKYVARSPCCDQNDRTVCTLLKEVTWALVRKMLRMPHLFTILL